MQHLVRERRRGIHAVYAYCRVIDDIADGAAPFIRLTPVEKMETVALWGPLPEGVAADEFTVPDKGLAQIEGEIAALEQQMADGEALLKQAAAHIPSFQAQILQALLREPGMPAQLELMAVIPWRDPKGAREFLVFQRDPITRAQVGGVRCRSRQDVENLPDAELSQALEDLQAGGDGASASPM